MDVNKEVKDKRIFSLNKVVYVWNETSIKPQIFEENDGKFSFYFPAEDNQIVINAIDKYELDIRQHELEGKFKFLKKEIALRKLESV